jgi:UDP-N-acetylmuramoyl-L-alanyl-D-glutamate--2,6-diaminopimelate ligase
MKRLVRKIIPQKAINLFRHLPTAVLANVIYGFPSRQMTVIGVTGTDGKTTTVNMIYQILKTAGKKVSMVSTINAEIAGKSYDTGFHVTNPDPLMLQKFIKMATQAGEEMLVLEVTSHGLDQYRAWGVHFDVGVITNITHEHLDYHKTWENYFQAKAKLIKQVKLAILNRTEDHYGRLCRLTSGKVVSFGLTKQADFNPIKFPFKLVIPGQYNVLNALAASAVAVHFGVDTKIIKRTLENFSSLEGRMNEIKNTRGIKIVVDFAHTPNALKEALQALRSLTPGRLIAVFGAAGARDIEKRALMGEISARFADITVITSEDPRGELDQINAQILEGAQKAKGELGKNVYIEGDRGKAIEMAINQIAKKGDTVGIFGKGHEKSMNYDGKKETPWSDHEAVKNTLSQQK